jgi:hypothetical protein
MALISYLLSDDCLIMRPLPLVTMEGTTTMALATVLFSHFSCMYFKFIHSHAD